MRSRLHLCVAKLKTLTEHAALRHLAVLERATAYLREKQLKILSSDMPFGPDDLGEYASTLPFDWPSYYPDHVANEAFVVQNLDGNGEFPGYRSYGLEDLRSWEWRRCVLFRPRDLSFPSRSVTGRLDARAGWEAMLAENLYETLACVAPGLRKILPNRVKYRTRCEPLYDVSLLVVVYDRYRMGYLPSGVQNVLAGYQSLWKSVLGNSTNVEDLFSLMAVEESISWYAVSVLNRAVQRPSSAKAQAISSQRLRDPFELFDWEIVLPPPLPVVFKSVPMTISRCCSAPVAFRNAVFHEHSAVRREEVVHVRPPQTSRTGVLSHGRAASAANEALITDHLGMRSIRRHILAVDVRARREMRCRSDFWKWTLPKVVCAPRLRLKQIPLSRSMRKEKRWPLLSRSMCSLRRYTFVKVRPVPVVEREIDAADSGAFLATKRVADANG
eukprot:IDg10331t1